MAAPDRRRPKGQDDLVDWFTVSYRSIYIAVGLVALLAVGVGYYYYTRNFAAPTLPIAPPSTLTTARTTTHEAAAGGVAVQESGESSVKLYQGTAKVETKTGQTVQLEANTQIKVDAAGKAAPAQNLPPVPVLLAPQHQAEITYQDPSRATTLLLWKPVPGATGYHVMLDYSAYFNRPLVDRSGIKDASQEIRGLDAGKYYWRVAAVDKEGVEGSFSDFARFTVSRPQGGGRGSGDPPLLAIDSLEVRQSILQVRGRTEAGATVTVNGHRARPRPAGLRGGPGGGRPGR